MSDTVEVPSQYFTEPYRFTPEDKTYVVIDTERWRIAGLPPMVEAIDETVTITRDGVEFMGASFRFNDGFTFTFAIGAKDAGNAFARR